MSIDIQLKSFTLFFIFGIIVNLLYTILLIKKTKFIWYYIIFPFISFVLIPILYIVNKGKFHPYFILILIIGYIFSKVSVKKIKKLTIYIKKNHKR